MRAPVSFLYRHNSKKTAEASSVPASLWAERGTTPDGGFINAVSALSNLAFWFICALMAVSSETAASATTQAKQWLRDPAISADGSLIAFRFDGDLYIVSAAGGDARLIAGGPGRQRAPVWLPSGDALAYASNSEGNDDIFIVGLQSTGAPRRITWHGYNETPLYFSLDGETLFYKSPRANLSKNRILYPPHDDWQGESVFAQSLQGGLPRVILDPDVLDAAPAGTRGRVLFVLRPGIESVFRKHDRSPANFDIWLMDTKRFVRVTTSPSHDSDPVWNNATDVMYFLSERGDSQNVWKQSLDDAAEPQQVTFHERHPVRDLSISRNGVLAYAFHGDIFVGEGEDGFSKIDIRLPDAVRSDLDTKTSAPPKVPVIQALYASDNAAIFTAGDATFVGDAAFAKALPILADQHCVKSSLSLSDDRRKLLAVCDRGDLSGFLTATLPFAAAWWTDKAGALTIRQFGFQDDIIFRAVLSPNGRYAAFLTSRALKLIELESGRLRTLISRSEGYYNHQQRIAWHPSSEHIAVELTRNERALSDIVVIRISDGARYNVSESGFNETAPHWTHNGHALTWVSDRHGLRNFQAAETSDLYALFFTPQAATAYRQGSAQRVDQLSAKAFQRRLESTAQAVKTGSANIVRLTASNTKNLTMMVSPDLDYAAWLRDDGEVWLKPLPEGNDVMLVSIDAHDKADTDDNYYSIGEANNGRELFIDGKGVAGWLDMTARRFIPLAGPAPAPEMGSSRPRVHQWIFERVVRSVREGYYRPEYLKKISWGDYVEAYRPFLDTMSDPYDFAELMEELLGELNSSHTSFDYSDPAADNDGRPGALGVIYDAEFVGPGWKIAEFLPGSPLTRAMPDLAPGSVIHAVDGVPIRKADQPAKLLARKADERIELTTRDANGRVRTGVVTAVDLESQGDMLYRRWLAWNEAEVARLSGGRLGYAHMWDMGEAAFRSMLDAVLGRHANVEGIVLDLRYNAGGWMHGPLLSFLSARYAFSLRAFGTVYASEPVLRIGKPFDVLVNAANYSNGSEVPALIQAQDVALLIGEPIAGTGLGSIDLEIPYRGYDGSYAHDISLTADGEYWENIPVIPDIIVRSERSKQLRNRDPQLEAAVANLLERIDD